MSLKLKFNWTQIERACGLGFAAMILGSAVCASQTLWTPLTTDWQSGTLMPHKYVNHHHGETDGSGEWVPDYAAIATMLIHTSARWSEVFAGTSPNNADVVLIPPGVSVIYDQISTQSFKAVVIQGMLEFDPHASTTLKVGTIVVEGQGALRITPASRTNHAEVIYSGPLDVNEDPRQFSVGLVTYGGHILVEGSRVGTCFALTRSARPGALTVTVASASGWRPGDMLIFPDQQMGAEPAHWSFPERYVSQTETIGIASVRGKRVTLMEPLQYNHAPTKQGWVGMLTRNVTFRSDLDAGGVRAHTLFGGHATVRFNHAALVDMGRTTVAIRDDTVMDAAGQPVHIGQNQRARYALHAHHVHEPVTFCGNTIFGQRSLYGSDRFGIVLHDSRGDIRSNIVVGARGSGIFLEDGSETGQVAENLIIGLGGGAAQGDDIRFAPLQGEDMAFGGFGIWARGPLMKIRRNIATGYFTQAAYGYHTHNNFVSGIVPNVPGTPEELIGQRIRVSQVPIQLYGAFEDNVALGIFRHGLIIQYQQPTNAATIKNFTATMLGTNSEGVHLHHCTGITLENARISGPGNGFGIVNNAGADGYVDVLGGSFAGLEIAVTTFPFGGRITKPRFLRNQWHIAVTEGSGQVEVYNYLGSRKNYRLYADRSEVPGLPLLVPGISGFALRLP